jgi:hypothetical protein
MKYFNTDIRVQLDKSCLSIKVEPTLLPRCVLLHHAVRKYRKYKVRL